VRSDYKDNYFRAIIREVKDGDTIRVEIITNFSSLNLSNNFYIVRLLYIDTPEVEENSRFERFVDRIYKKGNYLKRDKILYLGMLAKSNLCSLLKEDTIVKVCLFETNFFDIYGRILGVVFLNSTNINLFQIETGYGICYFYNNRPIREYKQAEKKAKLRKLGIWKYID